MVKNWSTGVCCLREHGPVGRSEAQRFENIEISRFIWRWRAIEHRIRQKATACMREVSMVYRADSVEKFWDILDGKHIYARNGVCVM